MNLVNRRDFLKTTGAGAGMARVDWRGVSIVADPHDHIASSGPAIWAAGELQRSLEAKGVSVQRRDSIAEAASNDFQIVLSGPARADVPNAAESFTLVPASA